MILLGPADIGDVVREVRQDIVGFAFVGDPCDFVRGQSFKPCDLVRLRRGNGLESGGDGQVFFILEAVGAAHGEREERDDRETFDEEVFHGGWVDD